MLIERQQSLMALLSSNAADTKLNAVKSSKQEHSLMYSKEATKHTLLSILHNI